MMKSQSLCCLLLLLLTVVTFQVIIEKGNKCQSDLITAAKDKGSVRDEKSKNQSNN